MKLLRVATEHGLALLRTDLILFAHEQGNDTCLYYDGYRLLIHMPFADYLLYWEKQGLVKDFLE